MMMIVTVVTSVVKACHGRRSVSPTGARALVRVGVLMGRSLPGKFLIFVATSVERYVCRKAIGSTDVVPSEAERENHTEVDPC
jgi:hypothetical protein